MERSSPPRLFFVLNVEYLVGGPESLESSFSGIPPATRMTVDVHGRDNNKHCFGNR